MVNWQPERSRTGRCAILNVQLWPTISIKYWKVLKTKCQMSSKKKKNFQKFFFFNQTAEKHFFHGFVAMHIVSWFGKVLKILTLWKFKKKKKKEKKNVFFFFFFWILLISQISNSKCNLTKKHVKQVFDYDMMKFEKKNGNYFFWPNSSGILIKMGTGNIVKFVKILRIYLKIGHQKWAKFEKKFGFS